MISEHSNSINVPVDSEHSHEISNWYVVSHDGWHLPSTEEQKVTCGQWSTLGCLDSKEHGKIRLDGQSYAGKVYVKHFQKSCFRADCKKCYLKWAAREAHKAARRIECYSKLSGKNPIHVVVSLPYKDWNLNHKVWRKKIYEILKKVGIKGGTAIYHPFRYNKELYEWYYSPHFHIIGFGWVMDVGKNYYETGYVIKNLGLRKSVYGTIYYQLTHAGIHKGKHSLVWFGALSYSKLNMPKEPRKDLCPVCEAPLYPVRFVGTDRPPPEEEFEDWFDVSGWIRSTDEYEDITISGNGITRTVRPYLDDYGGFVENIQKRYPALKRSIERIATLECF